MDKQNQFFNKSDEAERKAEYRRNKKFYTEDEKISRKKRAKEARELAEKLRRNDHKV